MQSSRDLKALRTLLLTSVAMTGLVASTADIQAQTVIDTPVVVTVTDTVDGEAITVTPSGSVTTSMVEEHAIDSDNSDVTISNDGALSTQGDGAQGVRSVGINATITNNGSITTEGTTSTAANSLQAYGIFSSGDTATITNNGTIFTSDNGSQGIRSEGIDATITNSGTITTLDSIAIHSSGNDSIITNNGTISAHSDGISAGGERSIITNNGTISATDGIRSRSSAEHSIITNNGIISASSDGITVSSANTTVINNGSISASGAGEGIITDGSSLGVTVFNNGTIYAEGADSHGVEIGDGDTIFTNSGWIVSTEENSIRFRRTGSILNLLPGSYLGGNVELASGPGPGGVINTTTVNIATGPSHSTLTQFTGVFAGGAPNFSGPVPGFYNAGTSQTATYDPTVLARIGGMTQDLAGGISGQVGGRFAPSAPSATRFANAFAAAADPASEEDAGAFDGFVSTYNPTTGSVHGAWVSGFGRFSSQDGNQAALDSDSWAAGLSVGYDQVINPSLTLGILAGFSTATLEADSRWVAGAVDHEAQGGYAGIYGRYAPSAHGWYAEGALLAGFLAHENVRFVNDNLAVGGVSSARSDYDSWWIAPELGVGYTYDTAENWTLTPSAQIRLAVQSFDGYTETGPSAANATIGSWTSSSLQGRVQLAASYTGYAGARITGRLGADVRTDIGDDSVSTTLIGQTQAMSTFADDTLAGFIGLDGQYALTDTTLLNFSTEFSAGDTGTSASARLEIRVMF